MKLCQPYSPLSRIVRIKSTQPTAAFASHQFSSHKRLALCVRLRHYPARRPRSGGARDSLLPVDGRREQPIDREPRTLVRNALCSDGSPGGSGKVICHSDIGPGEIPLSQSTCPVSHSLFSYSLRATVYGVRRSAMVSTQDHAKVDFGQRHRHRNVLTATLRPTLCKLQQINARQCSHRLLRTNAVTFDRAAGEG